MAILIEHEVKPMPTEKEESHITEAFGVRKCPKLVNQVRSAKRQVRVNALEVLCDELHNPMVVVGLIDAGVIPTLNKQVRTDADALTRERASKALSIAASDANGRRALLDAKTPSQILSALDDAETKVRKNAYEALIRVSSATLPAVHALIDAKYPSVLVGKAASENVTLQPLALRLLVQCLRDEVGLEEALANNAVETCITLLASFDTSVKREAASCLGMLCFAEAAKVTAIKGGAVPQLVDLMRDREVSERARGRRARSRRRSRSLSHPPPVPPRVRARPPILHSSACASPRSARS